VKTGASDLTTLHDAGFGAEPDIWSELSINAEKSLAQDFVVTGEIDSKRDIVGPSDS
jgi:hypothetical protein